MDPQEPTRFHRHHGLNIVLDSERVVATRVDSFANAITFSEKPLLPGEIFLVGIEERGIGWFGNMRIGLTQMNPNSEFPLPEFALPDLLRIGPSWMYDITPRRQEDLIEATNEAPEMVEESEANPVGPRSLTPPLLPPFPSPAVEPNVIAHEGVDNGHGTDGILEDALNKNKRHPKVFRKEGSLVRTPRGYIQLRALLQSKGRLDDNGGLTLRATEIGSLIGVMYIPTAENNADMHIIINGEDTGPCAIDIPYKTAPIFAAVDVYGSTKTVRIIQQKVETLKSMCRDAILKSTRLSGVSALPLPPILKNYLLYKL